MSGSNRNKFIALAGLAVVAIFLFLLIRDLSAVDSAYRHSAADASIKYERDAQAYVKERCFSSTRLSEPDCTAKADEAAREGQRKEQDLAAQNITAWWTKVMGIAALIGMALSAVGVWLVWTTFRETKASNVIAQSALSGQLRPWVKITVRNERRIRVARDLIELPVDCFFNNCGASPAINFCYHADLIFDDITREDLFSRLKAWFTEESNSYDEVNVFQGDGEHRTCEVGATGEFDGALAVNLIVAARYQSAFAEGYHYTAVMYRVTQIQNSSHVFDIPAATNDIVYHVVTLEPRENFSGIAT